MNHSSLTLCSRFARSRWWAGVWLVVACSAPPTNHAWADDWPTYRGDNARSGFYSGSLTPNLHLAWRFTPQQQPRPAWPAPARGSYWQNLSYIAPRIIDDNTFHPVLAGDAVLFASSADDSLYCLERSTGRLRWRTTTGGPIRYAPTVADGRVYVGSDDGHLYCLGLQNGELLWQKRLAASERLIPGNGRIISPWPIRTGVVVEDNIAYTAAGLYPSQGVFVYALDATTGEEIWQSQINHTAHGYLLLVGDHLVVPTGRSTPVLIRRSDGAEMGQLPGAAGTYAVVVSGQVLSGRGNDGSLTGIDLESRQSLVSLRAEQICTSMGNSYLIANERLTAMRLFRLVELTRRLGQIDQELQQTAPQREAARDDPQAVARLDEQREQLTREKGRLAEEKQNCQLWDVAADKTGAIAACESFVAVGGDGGIELRSPEDGSLLKLLPVDGQVLGLALGGQGLLAATDTGQLAFFATEPRVESPTAGDAINTALAHQSDGDQRFRQLAEESLNPAFGGTQGYALVLGAADEELIHALAANTDYTIVAIDEHTERIDALRAKLLAAGLYGSRVAAEHVPAEKLPFADYVFNLVVAVDGREPPWNRDEIDRVTRPFGGVQWLLPDAPTAREPLAGAGAWLHQYGNTSNTADSGDQHLSRPLQLQWFGGPGPARMVDRHLRAPAPLVNAGRMFVAGENAIVCVDSFNGTEYWQLDAPGSQRYSMPYDCGYYSTHGAKFALAARDRLWVVDVATGAVEREIAVPVGGETADCHWGYAALAGDRIYGTRQLATASRTEPSREQIDVDYGNEQPVVTSRSFFALAADDDRMLWEYEGAILNPTITVGDEVVYFVASAEPAMRNHATGRIPLGEFLSHAPQLVALAAASGEELWRQPLPAPLAECRNILYLQATGDRLVLSGSRLHAGDSWYRVAVLDRATGATLWNAEHAKGRAGAFTHGEQLHHPVVLGEVLVCEPMLYDLASGERLAPPGEPESWSIQRPGHSCGTMSGAGNCLLFRANNPTLLDLGDGPLGSDRFFNISPTRPGCWINIVAADGLVLIPEASASCVCHYSLQTSMAFQSVGPPPKETAAE